MHSLDREIYYSGVLLHKEGVFREALDVQDQIRGQPSDFEALHKVLLVGFVLLLRLAVEFCEQLIEIHLDFTISTCAGLGSTPFTCGMMFSLKASMKSGGGGKSQVKYRKFDSVSTS